MADIVEVAFKGQRKQFYLNPMEFPFRMGDYAIVEAEKGEDLGAVNQMGPLLKLRMKKPESELKSVLRKPREDDLARLRRNREREVRAQEVCKKKVAKHGLDMKLIDTEYQFDGNRLTFYFTADQRVDFRELVKDLAAEFRTRIELRQIGVRDEAKRVGGYGVCGRELCCTAHICEFVPITTQAAKKQNLPLNPNKLAGVCGRLKCCLMYEVGFYEEAVKKFPNLKRTVETEQGTGVVERVDIFREVVYVKMPDKGNGDLVSMPLSAIANCSGNCASQ